MDGGSAKFDRLKSDLIERGVARAFEGRLDLFTAAPLDETRRAAEAILARVKARMA
jgi:mitochondrial fission protein ELM1